MNEKRILITEVSGKCRNLRGTSSGVYCAAYPHGGWEKIKKEDCKKCSRDKYLTGISFMEAMEKVAYAIAKRRYGKENADCLQMSSSEHWGECLYEAEDVLETLLDLEN